MLRSWVRVDVYREFQHVHRIGPEPLRLHLVEVLEVVESTQPEISELVT